MINDLKINLENGLLEPILYQPSPHQDDRPEDESIDLIVIHGISLPPKQFGGKEVVDFFCGQLDINRHPYFAEIANMKVSAHLFINRNGEIVQFVSFKKRAWHAGESLFQDRHRCNDFSIGIELEGTDDLPYETKQYQRLTQVIRLLMQAYPLISYDRIVGHADIAPGRKTDPGPFFDWSFMGGIST